jgi:hypothetical protein
MFVANNCARCTRGAAATHTCCCCGDALVSGDGSVRGAATNSIRISRPSAHGRQRSGCDSCCGVPPSLRSLQACVRRSRHGQGWRRWRHVRVCHSLTATARPSHSAPPHLRRARCAAAHGCGCGCGCRCGCGGCSRCGGWACWPAAPPARPPVLLLLPHSTCARVVLPRCTWSPCFRAAGLLGCLSGPLMRAPLTNVPLRLPASLCARVGCRRCGARQHTAQRARVRERAAGVAAAPHDATRRASESTRGNALRHTPTHARGRGAHQPPALQGLAPGQGRVPA